MSCDAELFQHVCPPLTMLMSVLWNRTFRELSKAEEQLSLCRELCEDLAVDLKKEDLKVGCSALIAGLFLLESTEASEVLSYGLSFNNIIFGGEV